MPPVMTATSPEREGTIEREREGGRERERDTERKRERERGTTLQSHDCPEVRRSPGSWLPSQAPAAPCPSFPAGEVPVALPPGNGHEQIGDRAQTLGPPTAPCLTPGRRPLPTSWAADHPPPSLWPWLPQPLSRVARRASPETRGLLL